MLPCLYIVVPCYNEQEVLPLTAPVFGQKIDSLIASGIIADSSRVLFIDDGSNDKTWEIINDFCKEKYFTGVSLSRNCGHQNALLAGLKEAEDKCDITISMDADGQDDIDAVDAMIKEYIAGSDIVYGVRNDRKTDSVFKRSSARTFYRIMKLMGAETVYDHADFRLLSNRVLKALDEFEEVNIYLRGMIPLVGFRSSCVEYSRKERVAGRTHYNLGKMLRLATDGITSFSVKPLRFITVFGILISLVSLGLIVYSLVQYFLGNVVAGWASTMVTVSFIGGIQMISIGILGEYIGKIYKEVKHRPRFIVSERTDNYTEEGINNV